MAKKAKLDILEVSIDHKGEEPSAPAQEPEKAAEAVPLEPLPRERSVARIIAWLRGHLLWLIPLAALLIALLAGAFLWLGWERETPVTAEPPKLPVSETRLPLKGEFVYFEGFAVDQKSDKGEFRIAFCDIAIALGKPELAKGLGDRIDVRNVIYTVLKGKKAEDGLSGEKRGLMKAEIKSELNRLLGDEAVSEVYFTRYEVN